METRNEAASGHTNYGGSGCSEITSYSNSVEKPDSETQTETEVEASFSYRRLSRRHKCLFASICTTSFILMMSESIMSPLYPEETAIRGISTVLSGWVFASYALGQVLFSPLVGKYLPKIGARFVYLAGVFFAGGCTLLFGILDYIPVQDGQTIFVVFCILMQIVLSIGVTAQQTATFTMASREFGSNFTAVFGMTEVFVGLGMTVGPAIGGFLYTLGGFHLPFVVVGCLIILSLPFNYFLLPSRHDDEERQTLLSTNDEVTVLKEKKKGRSAVSIILSDPTAIVTLFCVMLGSAMWSVLDPILEPRLTDFGLTPELSGVMFLILSASYALSSPMSSWVADRLGTSNTYGCKRLCTCQMQRFGVEPYPILKHDVWSDNRILMIPGFMVCCLSHFLLGSSPVLGFDPDYREIWLTILSLITLGFAISMAVIPSYEIILDVATDRGLEDNMGTNSAVAGIWCSMYAVGDFIGPIYGGWMVETGGFAWTLTYTGLACILASVLLTLSAIYDKKCRKGQTSSIEEDQCKLLHYTDSDFLTFASVYMMTMMPPYQLA